MLVRKLKAVSEILVDNLGLIIMVLVQSAARQDYEGALYVFWRLRGWLSRRQLVWADSVYTGSPVTWAATFCKFVLQIVLRPEEAKGFVLVRRR